MYNEGNGLTAETILFLIIRLKIMVANKKSQNKFIDFVMILLSVVLPCIGIISPVFAEEVSGVGVPSSIKKIYIVSHSHLDIGFTQPPNDLSVKYKTMIDSHIAFAKSHADYKWNIEETWQLEQWLSRSSQTEIDDLVTLVLAGRIGVMGGHSTLHSAKVGVEEMNRFLWNAKNYREEYGFTIETVMHNDVPGVNWSYPQTLAKSGIKYLISGQNHFIGGGISQPYKSYLFNWEGPDGSRVLTWSAQNSYIEGFDKYGLPFFSNAPIDTGKLTSALGDLTSAGYPYDAVMVQYAFDNAATSVLYSLISDWNATEDNPEFILATPRDFFEYILGKYGGAVPVRSGNWTTRWDTGQMLEPQSEKIVKNAQDLVPAAEKMWSVASVLELGAYPKAEFDNAWDMMLTVDEHSGGGGGWPGYWTQEEVNENNEQHWAFAQSCQSSATTTLDSASDTLLAAAALADSNGIVVFNSLSWTRSGLVRVELDPMQFAKTFSLIDTITSSNVTYQKDSLTSEILFVAENVPSVGFKRFEISDSAPPAPSTSLSVGSDFVESSLFRVEVNSNGYISSIYDKSSTRELVDVADSFDFNRSIVATNGEYFFGNYHTVANPTSVVSTGMSGPVAASLKIANSSHPVAGVEIVLYEGLGRIDVINTVDRTQMEMGTLSNNSVYYGFTFPFNLSSYTARIETAAGWMNPGTDSIAGSYKDSHGIQHGVDISEGSYGITLACPDVYIHSFTKFQNGGGVFPPPQPTIVSTFIRKSDETQLKGGGTGYVIVEPGASSQWDLHYSFKPHTGSFDAVREGRFGWEVGTPMLGRQLPAAGGGALSENSQSFFSVDASNIIITDVKKANFGSGLIVKLQEIAKTADTPVALSSDFSGKFYRVFKTTPLEKNIERVALSGSGSEIVDVNMAGSEILCLRLEFEKLPGDFNSSGQVNWEDLRILGNQWLGAPNSPSADIAPPLGVDGTVNFLDFALFGKDWFEGIAP
jgi:alpha-mannosidase